MSGGLAAGQLVDERYTLEAVRERGELQTVWRAHDRGLVRTVCLREIQLRSEDPARRRQALQGARAAIRLDHPRAIPVYDAILDDDRLVVVSEWFPVRSLGEVIARKKRLPVKRAAAIGLDVLEALVAGHGRGLVHGSVNPSFVLLPEDAPARLDGFGLAPPFDDPDSISWVVATGDPRCIAPEQARTEGSTPASDLWSLGATLYYAVEGVHAFGHSQTGLAVISSVIEDTARPPRHAGRLKPVLDRLLARDRADRPPVEEVRDQLAEVAGVALTSTEKQARRRRRHGGGEPQEDATAAEEVDSNHDWDAVVYGAEAVVRPEPSPVPAGDGWITWGPPAEAVQPPAGNGAAGTPAGAAEAEEQRSGRFRSTPSWPPPPHPRVVAGLVSVLLTVVLIALLVTNGVIGLPGKEDTDTSTAEQRPELRTDPAAVPADWIVHRNARGNYGISYPPTWSLREDGSTLVVRDAASGTELRIEHRRRAGEEDPRDRWAELERTFTERYPDYRRLQLTPATYLGHRAALWEFTYSDGGRAIHAVDVAVDTKRQEFALFFQAPAASWDQMLPVFSGFLSSFQPPR